MKLVGSNINRSCRLKQSSALVEQGERGLVNVTDCTLSVRTEMKCYRPLCQRYSGQTWRVPHCHSRPWALMICSPLISWTRRLWRQVKALLFVCMFLLQPNRFAWDRGRSWFHLFPPSPRPPYSVNKQ